MHPVILHGVWGLLILTALAGCMEEENRYGGVGLQVVNNYSGDPTYIKAWDQSESTFRDIVCGGGAMPPDYNACMSTVIHCSTPEKPHHQYGNHLREGIFLEVALYEAKNVKENSWGRSGEPGDEIGSWRWDGLECFKGYTLVLQPGPRAELYRCDGCLDPAKWRNPLPSTRV